MMSNEQPQIAEAVYALSDLAPDELAILREISPFEMLPELERGGTAGPAGDNQFKIRIRTSNSGLKAAILDALLKADKLTTNNKWARRIQLASAILTAICTSAWGVSLANGSRYYSDIFGILSIVGIVCTLVSEYLNRLDILGNTPHVTSSKLRILVFTHAAPLLPRLKSILKDLNNNHPVNAEMRKIGGNALVKNAEKALAELNQMRFSPDVS